MHIVVMNSFTVTQYAPQKCNDMCHMHSKKSGGPTIYIYLLCDFHQVAGTCECGEEPSGSIKRGEFLDQLQTS